MSAQKILSLVICKNRSSHFPQYRQLVDVGSLPMTYLARITKKRVNSDLHYTHEFRAKCSIVHTVSAQQRLLLGCQAPISLRRPMAGSPHPIENVPTGIWPLSHRKRQMFFDQKGERRSEETGKQHRSWQYLEFLTANCNQQLYSRYHRHERHEQKMF